MAKLDIMKKSALFKRTIPYFKKEVKLIILAIILSLVIASLSAFTPFITKNILDKLLPNNDYDMIVKSLILYAAIVILLSLSRYLFQYINTLTGMRIEKRIREEAIEKINYLPVDYFALEPDGKIVAKITSDSAGVRTFFTTIASIVQAMLNIIIVYVGVLIMEPWLGVLILILIPILSVWITIYRKKVHKYYVDLRETGSRITGKLNELISGALIIQDFNQEEEMMGEYKELINFYNKCDKKANTINHYFGWELLSLIKRLAEIGLLMFLGFSSINAFGVVISIGLISAFTENLDKMIAFIDAQ